MAVPVQMQGQFAWTVRRPSPERRFVAVCEPLGLAMEANSLDELYSLINEAVALLIVDLIADNEIESFMREIGWKIIGPLPTPAQAKDVQFILPPVELIVQQSAPYGAERRAT